MSTLAAPRPLDPARLARHMDRLLSFARRLCGRDGDAEDLVQDTLERVLRRPRVVTGSETAYLVQALRNTHRSRLRAACSRVRTTAMPECLEPVDHLAEERLMSAQRAREVLDAVAALPHAFRQAVVLVDVQGLRSADAARELGVAEGTLASRLYRGRAQVALACGA
jgi:RNA polymerase sigma-70 factor (ECF subfamily)